MHSSGERLSGAAARARDWYHRRHAAICDVLEPWQHGTVALATSYPSYYDFNLVRVEDDPAMSVEALIAFADEALSGYEHRRLVFDLIEAAVPLRPAFEAKGWLTERLLFMRHESPPPPGEALTVEEVDYESVEELRVIWHGEDYPDQDPADFHAQAREVARRQGVRVFALREQGSPVAFAQLEHAGEAAEITSVYVHPEHRGGGHGTALTRAVIGAAGAVDDLWISADDEDRPKELYARLGFRPAFTAMEFMRLP